MTATYVFDAGPLHYFAGAGQLEALRALCGDARCTVTTAVLHELRRGTNAQPRLQDALDAEWIDHVTLDELAELQAFAVYAQQIGSSPVHDTGEAATLAWAEIHAATAIVARRACRSIVAWLVASRRPARSARSASEGRSGARESHMNQIMSAPEGARMLRHDDLGVPAEPVPEIMALIARAPWREAVTYRDTWPHEYVVVKKDGQQALLAAFCARIARGEGVEGRFFGQTATTSFRAHTSTG